MPALTLLVERPVLINIFCVLPTRHSCENINEEVSVSLKRIYWYHMLVLSSTRRSISPSKLSVVYAATLPTSSPSLLSCNSPSTPKSSNP
jgi:hypothetical protein